MKGERLRWVLGMGRRGDGAAGHWNSPKPCRFEPCVSVWMSRVQYFTLTRGLTYLPFSSKVFGWCCILVPILKAPVWTSWRMAFLGGKHNLGLLPLIGNVQGKRLFVSVYPFHFTLDHTAFDPKPKMFWESVWPWTCHVKAVCRTSSQAWNMLSVWKYVNANALSYASSVTTADIIMKEEENLIKRRISFEIKISW